MVPAFHIGLLLQPLLLAGMIMTGTTKTIYQSTVGRAMLWFTGWMLLCIPFATWKGGGVRSIYHRVAGAASHLLHDRFHPQHR